MLMSEEADFRVRTVMKGIEGIEEQYTEEPDVYQVYASLNIKYESDERRSWMVRSGF